MEVISKQDSEMLRIKYGNNGSIYERYLRILYEGGGQGPESIQRIISSLIANGIPSLDMPTIRALRSRVRFRDDELTSRALRGREVLRKFFEEEGVHQRLQQAGMVLDLQGSLAFDDIENGDADFTVSGAQRASTELFLLDEKYAIDTKLCKVWGESGVPTNKWAEPHGLAFQFADDFLDIPAILQSSNSEELTYYNLKSVSHWFTGVALYPHEQPQLNLLQQTAIARVADPLLVSIVNMSLQDCLDIRISRELGAD